MKQFLLFWICLAFCCMEPANAFSFSKVDAVNEIIYLNTDRNVYEVGERIWFSTLHFDAHKLTPLYKSDVLYFLILDQHKNVVERKKFNIRLGTTNGSYLIPSDLEAGIYYLFAYTKNSLNNKALEKSAVPIAIHKLLPKRMSLEYKATQNDLGELALHLRFHRLDGTQIQKGRVELIYENLNKKERQMRYKLTDSSAIDITVKDPEKKNLDVIKVLFKNDNSEEAFFIHLPRWDENTVTLFPEGGFIQPNQQQTVAYRFNHQYQKTDTLYLFENDKILQKIPTENRRIGQFSFVPKKDKDYTVKTGIRSDKIYSLDVTSENSIRLSLLNTSERNKIIRITPNGNFNQENVTLKILQRGRELRQKSYRVSSEPIQDSLSFSESEKGVVLLALYNENEQLLSHRFAFVQNTSAITLKPTTRPEKSYHPNESVQLNLTSLNSGNPITSRYSVSIHRKSMEPSYYSNRFADHFLLNIDFTKTTPPFSAEDIAVDHLLMTYSLNDYRWFDTKESLFKNISDDIEVAIEKSFVSGKGKSLGGKDFMVMCNGSLSTFTTNSDGKFIIPKELIQTHNECSLLRNKLALLYRVYVNDLSYALDSIVGQLNFAVNIQKQENRAAFFDTSNTFSFYNFNVLEDIDLSKKKKRKESAYSERDFVCPWNILNCHYCFVTGEPIMPPEKGKTYRIKVGSLYRKIVYDDAVSNAPIALLSVEKNVSFLFVQKDILDLHSKTAFWQHFYTSPKKGQIDIEFTAPETRGVYHAIVKAYDEKGNFGSYEFEFVVQ